MIKSVFISVSKQLLVSFATNVTEYNPTESYVCSGFVCRKGIVTKIPVKVYRIGARLKKFTSNGNPVLVPIKSISDIPDRTVSKFITFAVIRSEIIGTG